MCLQQLLQRTSYPKLAGWILTNLDRNALYIALFIFFSNGSGLLHYLGHIG